MADYGSSRANVPNHEGGDFLNLLDDLNKINWQVDTMQITKEWYSNGLEYYAEMPI